MYVCKLTIINEPVKGSIEVVVGFNIIIISIYTSTYITSYVSYTSKTYIKIRILYIYIHQPSYSIFIYHLHHYLLIHTHIHTSSHIYISIHALLHTLYTQPSIINLAFPVTFSHSIYYPRHIYVI